MPSSDTITAPTDFYGLICSYRTQDAASSAYPFFNKARLLDYLFNTSHPIYPGHIIHDWLGFRLSYVARLAKTQNSLSIIECSPNNEPPEDTTDEH